MAVEHSIRACGFCGNSFVRKPKAGFPSKYCSADCKRQADNRHERIRRIAQTCYMDGCGKPANGANGMCSGHYYKLRTYGDPNKGNVSVGRRWRRR